MRDQADIKAYHRRKLVVRLISSIVTIVYLAAWWPLADRLAPVLADAIGLRAVVLIVLAAIIFGLFELLTLPLSIYSGYVLEHRYDLSNETPRAFAINTLKQLAVGGVIGLIVLMGLYLLVWYAGAFWWLWAWSAWVALLVLLARLLPTVILPIFYKATPIDDQPLVDSLVKLAAESGLAISAVQSIDLSKDTKKVNAALVGMGGTRRVLLSDTLLDRFDLRQIAVVFAHELGHHRRRHIWKLLALSAVTSTALIAVVVWFLASHAGPAADRWPKAVAALPKFCLGVALLSFVLQPIMCAVSRRFETHCDLDALTLTRDPQAFRDAMTQLGTINLADPDPHPLMEWYYYDHPALKRRIALADRFEPSPVDR